MIKRGDVELEKKSKDEKPLLNDSCAASPEMVVVFFDIQCAIACILEKRHVFFNGITLCLRGVGRVGV